MDDSNPPTEYDGPSKSQLKRDSHALQAMGKELVEMPEGKLQKFNLPDSLKEAIYEARKLKSREAKRRHLQYIEDDGVSPRGFLAFVLHRSPL